MDDGRVILAGSSAEVFSHVDELKASGLGVPQVTELFHNLALAGITDGETVVDEEEGARLLFKVLSNEQ